MNGRQHSRHPDPDSSDLSQASGSVSLEAAAPVEPVPPSAPTAVAPSSPQTTSTPASPISAPPPASSPPSAPTSPKAHGQSKSLLSDSRRGSLSALRAADPSTAKSLKLTSSFPLPQPSAQPQSAVPAHVHGRDSPSSPRGRRNNNSHTRSPKEVGFAAIYTNNNANGGGGGGGSSGGGGGVSVSLTPVSAPASVSLGSVPPPINTHVWPYAPVGAGTLSLGDAMLPPAALTAPASPSSRGGADGQRSGGGSGGGPLRTSVSAQHIPPLPPLPSRQLNFPTFLQHQQYQLQQQMQLQQWQAQQAQLHGHAPGRGAPLFAPAPQHASHSANYLQQMHDEAAQQQYWEHMQNQQQQQQQQQHQQQQQYPQQQLSQHVLAVDPLCDAGDPQVVQQHWDSYLRTFVPPLPPGPGAALASAMSVGSVSASPPSGGTGVTPLYNSSASRDSLDEVEDAEDEGGRDNDDDEEEEEDEYEKDEEDSDDSEGVAVRGRSTVRATAGNASRHRSRAVSSSSESLGASDDAHSQERGERIGDMRRAAAAVDGTQLGTAAAAVPPVLHAATAAAAAGVHSLQLPFTSPMRKAQSAADFKSFSSHSRSSHPGRGRGGGGGGGPGDLGVLTPFYSSETGTFVGSGTAAGGAGLVSGSRPLSVGGSGNASSSSLHNASLRASTSHAVLQSSGGASASSGPPLVAHFSLSSGPKSNGQPRGQRSELAMVTEKLREMSVSPLQCARLSFPLVPSLSLNRCLLRI